MTSVAVVIPSYNGVDRTRFMLDTLVRNDPDAQKVPILVVEDKFANAPSEEVAIEVSNGYDALELDYPVQVYHSPTWGNMHGNAKLAFEIAFSEHNPDWVVYLGDDLAFTPGSLSNMLHFLTENPLETIGLVQFPYWNAGDLAFSTSEREDCLFFDHHKSFYEFMEWTLRVPRNPHWDGVNDPDYPGIARPYINVNGCGFAAHAETYREVGGFADGTWCLDESLSWRVWTGSNRAIVCLPGPPLVHYFGASTMARPVLHDMHTHERWVEAIGHSKSDCDKIMRAKMAEREAAVVAETRKASYWTEKSRSEVLSR